MRHLLGCGVRLSRKRVHDFRMRANAHNFRLNLRRKWTAPTMREEFAVQLLRDS